MKETHKSPRNKRLIKKKKCILCPTRRHTVFRKDAGGGGAQVPGGATPTSTLSGAPADSMSPSPRRCRPRRARPVRWPKGSAPGYDHGPGTKRVGWTREVRCALSLAPTAGPHLTRLSCSHQEVALKEALGRVLESSKPRGGGEGGPRSLGSAVSQ